MSERNARSPVEPLQLIRHGRRCGRRSNAVPRVHELSRRIDLKEFTLKRVRLATGDAGGAPPPPSVNIARPLPRIEDAGPDPPICDRLRGQSLEHAFRGSREFHAGGEVSFRGVGGRVRLSFADAVHVGSPDGVKLLRRRTVAGRMGFAWLNSKPIL